MARTSAFEAVDSGSIPKLVQTKNFRILIFTDFLLGVYHLNEIMCRDKVANLLVVSLINALNMTSPALSGV